MVNPRYLIALLFVLTGLAGGAWFFAKAVKPASSGPIAATVLPEPRPLPAFEFTDERGDPFGPAQLRDDWHLAFFGFTHCPDICPATLQQLAVAVRRLEDSGMDKPPRILLISVDPQRDTPARLAAYTDNFGPRVLGVTGTMEQLQQLTGPLGIAFARGEGQGDNYNVDHSTAVLLFNPQAEWHAVFSAPHDIGELVNDLPLIMSGQ